MGGLPVVFRKILSSENSLISRIVFVCFGRIGGFTPRKVSRGGLKPRVRYSLRGLMILQIPLLAYGHIFRPAYVFTCYEIF